MKRSKIEIYASILKAIEEDIAEYGEARMTRVQGKANLPYDRFKMHLSTLEKLGMVRIVEFSRYRSLTITQKGKKFLKEYNKIMEFLRYFGL